jgi:ABC-type transport system involved in cytochrome bd biosynthesis fused ATPase/permease subunit
VQAALDNVKHGRTTIVIAHRLNTVKDSDKIVVLGAPKRKAGQPKTSNATVRRVLCAHRQRGGGGGRTDRRPFFYSILMLSLSGSVCVRARVCTLRTQEPTGVLEMGTHTELLEKQGAYYKLAAQ